MSAVKRSPSGVRRNILAIVGDVVLYMVGFACFDPTTVMPQFLRELGASPQLIGLISTLRMLMIVAPQAYVAHLLHGRSRVKPFLVTACFAGRTPLLLLFLLVWLYGQNRPLVLWSFVLFTLVFLASEGFAVVPWTEIIGKTIPESIRGRFLGTLQTLSSLAALAAPMLINYVLKLPHLDFPRNYALLLLVSAASLVASAVFLTFLWEPSTPRDVPERTFGQNLRHLLSLWRRDRALRLALTTQILLSGGGIASSFYILYARERFGLPESYVSVYLTAQMMGGVLTGVLWGWLADRIGAVRALQVVVLLALIPPVGALFIPVDWGFVVVFACLGALFWSIWNAIVNVILSIAPPEERPSYIALQNFAGLPSAITPLIGGVIVQWAGYYAAFIVAALTVSTALWSAARIPSPQATVRVLGKSW
ncbi:MAG: MFS transporter [Armatimonadota bacterium]|nr:MFS transporter [Armatimonadota bacterium]MDW8289610.1 MFS transporter [Armatimonadota bacterium]